jgi:hypothetical protein
MYLYDRASLSSASGKRRRRKRDVAVNCSAFLDQISLYNRYYTILYCGLQVILRVHPKMRLGLHVFPEILKELIEMLKG